jgi:hypothetical protein
LRRLRAGRDRAHLEGAVIRIETELRAIHQFPCSTRIEPAAEQLTDLGRFRVELLSEAADARAATAGD